MKAYLIFLRLFFKSWYGNIGALMLMAILSSAFVTFYTTNVSLLQSMRFERHLSTWFFTFLLMQPLMLGIGLSVFSFDRSAYFQRNELHRWMLQGLLLMFMLSFISLNVVYFVYAHFLHIDLKTTEYFERDFVVVLSCIAFAQVYYKIRADRLVTKDAKLTNEVLLQEKCQLEEELAKIRSVLLEKEQRIQHLDQLLRKSGLLLEESRNTIGFQAEGGAMLPIPILNVSSIFIDKRYAGSKIIHARLTDGRVGVVDSSSLKKLEEQYPILLMRVGRHELISKVWIRQVTADYKKNEFYLDLYDVGHESVYIDKAEFLDIKRDYDWLLSLSTE